MEIGDYVREQVSRQLSDKITNIEAYITAYLNLTGENIEDLELCHQNHGNGVTSWFLRKRTKIRIMIDPNPF